MIINIIVVNVKKYLLTWLPEKQWLTEDNYAFSGPNDGRRKWSQWKRWLPESFKDKGEDLRVPNRQSLWWNSSLLLVLELWELRVSFAQVFKRILGSLASFLNHPYWKWLAYCFLDIRNLQKDKFHYGGYFSFNLQQKNLYASFKE